MSLRDVTNPVDRSSHPIAVELAVIVAVITGFSLWQRLLTSARRIVFGLSELSLWVTDGIFVGSVILFVAVYTDYRGLGRGLQLPGRSDLPLVVAAGGVPVVCAGLTKLVGSVTGVPHNSLIGLFIGADATLGTVLTLTARDLFVSVPILVVVSQLLIQGSFKQLVDDGTAIGLTVIVAGFLLEITSGGLIGLSGGIPAEGKLIGVLVFVALLGWGRYASSRLEADRRRFLAYVPLAVFVVFSVLSGIAAIESIARGLFVVTLVSTLAVAAYSYERTDSIVPPAVTYTSLGLVNVGIVFVFEAGVPAG